MLKLRKGFFKMKISELEDAEKLKPERKKLRKEEKTQKRKNGNMINTNIM